MRVSLTKMSENGQIVIPSEIRKDGNIAPKTKFLVINNGNDILLKRIDEQEIAKELLKKIRKSEQEIKKGLTTSVNASTKEEDIDALLMQ